MQLCKNTLDNRYFSLEASISLLNIYVLKYDLGLS